MRLKSRVSYGSSIRWSHHPSLVTERRKPKVRSSSETVIALLAPNRDRDQPRGSASYRETKLSQGMLSANLWTERTTALRRSNSVAEWLHASSGVYSGYACGNRHNARALMASGCNTNHTIDLAHDMGRARRGYRFSRPG